MQVKLYSIMLDSILGYETPEHQGIQFHQHAAIPAVCHSGFGSVVIRLRKGTVTHLPCGILTLQLR